MSRLAKLSAEQAALLDALITETADAVPRDASTAPRAVLIQQGDDGEPPLFLVHGAGGRVMFLHAIARRLPPSQTVYGLEAADGDSPSAKDGHGLLDGYLLAIAAAQPQGPYRLGAYSAGCLIAFQLAAKLRAQGETVTFLLFIDPVAPPDAGRKSDRADEPAGPHERLQKRFEIAALAGITPISPEFPYVEAVSRRLAMVASSFEAVRIDHRIHVIHGQKGDYVAACATLDRWAALAGGGLDRAPIDADHFEIVRDPYAAVVAEQIQRWLGALPGQDHVGV